MVSLMTALWFAHLRGARPRVGQAARLAGPARDQLPARRASTRATCRRLREFGGLQSYPSRTQGPRPGRLLDRLGRHRRHRADLGRARAPLRRRALRRARAAGARSRCSATPSSTRAPCWEAIVDPMVARLGEVLWVVDLNRQSLDRVVPDIAAGRLAAMFEAAGWHSVTVKYGRRLRALFARDGGEALRARIDAMPNEEYQRLLRADAAQLRERLPGGDAGDRAADRRPRGRASCWPPSATSAATTSARCSTPTAQADAVARPPVASSSPTRSRAGGCRPRATRPTTRRCSTTSSSRELAPAARRRRRDDPWARLRPTARAEARAVRGGGRAPASASRVARRDAAAGARATSGASTRARRRPSRRSGASSSTSPTRRPRSPTRVVTVSPDVGIVDQPRRLDQPGRHLVRSATASTGSPTTPTRSCAGASPTTAATSSSASPRSTSSACSASSARRGRATASRCCRSARSTTRSSRARSSRGRSASTPAGSRSSSARRRGVTLGPEGGAHQSVITPSIGIEQPGCVAWEPAFGQDLEWTLPARARRGSAATDGTLGLLPALDAPDRPGARRGAADDAEREQRRATCWPAATGCARATRRGRRSRSMGALVPEALAAADELARGGHRRRGRLPHERRPRLPRASRRAPGSATATRAILERLFPRAAPARHACSTATRTRSPSSAGVHGAPIACLGRARSFGQSGDIADLYAPPRRSTPRRSSAPRSTCG